jgi:uncharacterized membrane protein
VLQEGLQDTEEIAHSLGNPGDIAKEQMQEILTKLSKADL